MNKNKDIVNKTYLQFLEALKSRVLSSRYNGARSVNKELILLYHQEISKLQQEHGWGAKIIDQLSKDLHAEFPEMKGFSPRNLKYMRKFAQEYPDVEFVQEVLAQLPSKNNVLAEYILRDMTKPIGLAEYRLNAALPENLKTALPSIEELEAELSKEV